MIAIVLRYLFPGINLMTEVELLDLGDGVFIAGWNRPEPQPTPEEIQAAYPAALAAQKRAAIQPITRAQAKAGLIIKGLIAQVQPAINAIQDPIERALAQNDWDERLTFERGNPTLAKMALALGLSDDQLDDLFAFCATL